MTEDKIKLQLWAPGWYCKNCNSFWLFEKDAERHRQQTKRGGQEHDVVDSYTLKNGRIMTEQ